MKTTEDARNAVCCYESFRGTALNILLSRDEITLFNKFWMIECYG